MHSRLSHKSRSFCLRMREYCFSRKSELAIGVWQCFKHGRASVDGYYTSLSIILHHLLLLYAHNSHLLTLVSQNLLKHVNIIYIVPQQFHPQVMDIDTAIFNEYKKSKHVSFLRNTIKFQPSIIWINIAPQTNWLATFFFQRMISPLLLTKV